MTRKPAETAAENETEKNEMQSKKENVCGFREHLTVHKTDSNKEFPPNFSLDQERLRPARHSETTEKLKEEKAAVDPTERTLFRSPSVNDSE